MQWSDGLSERTLCALPNPITLFRGFLNLSLGEKIDLFGMGLSKQHGSTRGQLPDQMAGGTLFSWHVGAQSKGQQGVTCFNVFKKSVHKCLSLNVNKTRDVDGLPSACRGALGLFLSECPNTLVYCLL